MAVELADIRAAFVYVETVLDVLMGELQRPNYPFLADPFAYAAKFDETNKQRNEDVEPPWRYAGGRSFWSYYFGDREFEHVDGKVASHSVTPLRHRFPLDVVQPKNARLAPEAFVYPHGVAVIVNLTLTGPYSLEQAATELLTLRLDRQFQIKGQPGPLVLDALAGQALTALRRAAFGDEVRRASRPLGAPFSIVSIVRGDGVDKSAPLKEGGDEQRFLDAVTTWSRNWENVTPQPLKKTTLPIRAKGTPASHVLYAHDRGRAAWFPSSFVRPSSKVQTVDPVQRKDQPSPVAHTVACFHRNLLLASLQVESLANFAVATTRVLDGQLTSPHFDAARRATDVLGRFYGAAPTIYRSRSPEAQMNQGGFVPDINAVRAAVRRPPLFVPT